MPVEPGKTELGFVGLGIMGAPMALNLIKAGFALKVYNRTDRPRVQEVVDAGGKRVETPAAAADATAIVRREPRLAWLRQLAGNPLGLAGLILVVLIVFSD